ncbi:hypothetical protein M2317_000762 [Microbacterium sp. ZKA21]|uniref:hypothetical protein n=1 Tax=Microbacterium sp. ZKA21 TaxID=3381694 RepID=UPI003D21B379
MTTESAGRVPDQTTTTIELTRGQLAILRDALYEWKDGDAEFCLDPDYSHAVNELVLVLFRAEAGL